MLAGSRNLNARESQFINHYNELLSIINYHLAQLVFVLYDDRDLSTEAELTQLTSKINSLHDEADNEGFQGLSERAHEYLNMARQFHNDREQKSPTLAWILSHRTVDESFDRDETRVLVGLFINHALTNRDVGTEEGKEEVVAQICGSIFENSPDRHPFMSHDDVATVFFQGHLDDYLSGRPKATEAAEA